jgi:Uma2 family endonuclease
MRAVTPSYVTRSPRAPEWEALEESLYPECDGLPRSNNTLHFDWITFLKSGLERLFASRPDVFVAGDLMWYPAKGFPDVRVAPDIMVVLNRPKGHRGSYRQWREANTPPQVVFEVLSPSNSTKEMAKKLEFFNTYGVQEYYIYNAKDGTFEAWIRRNGGDLELAEEEQGHVSRCLGVTFWISPGDRKLHVVGSDNQPLLTYDEQADRADAEKKVAAQERAVAKQAQNLLEQERVRSTRAEALAEEARAHAEEARARAEQAETQAEQGRIRAEALADRLRQLGIDPNAL